MKPPLIYLKQDQWEVVLHLLCHLSCHNCRKASLKVDRGAQKQKRTITSPLTPYSQGFPILQPGGGAKAREVGKESLMSTSKSSRARSDLVVSIAIPSPPPPASQWWTLHISIRCFGPLWVVSRSHRKEHFVVTVGRSYAAWENNQNDTLYNKKGLYLGLHVLGYGPICDRYQISLAKSICNDIQHAKTINKWHFGCIHIFKWQKMREEWYFVICLVLSDVQGVINGFLVKLFMLPMPLPLTL